jgi:hypothetical protein
MAGGKEWNLSHSKRSARKLKLEENNSREDVVLKHLPPAKVRVLIDTADPFLQPMLKPYALTGMRKNKGGIVLHDLRHFAAFQLVKQTDDRSEPGPSCRSPSRAVIFRRILEMLSLHGLTFQLRFDIA